MFGKKWKDCYVRLWDDSTLEIFNGFEDSANAEPLAAVVLEYVHPFICVGLKTKFMPVANPEVPPDYSPHNLVGIATDASASTVYWLDKADLTRWFDAIRNTIPELRNQRSPSPNPSAPSADPGNGAEQSYSPNLLPVPGSRGRSPSPSLSNGSNQSRSGSSAGGLLSSFGKHFSKGTGVIKKLVKNHKTDNSHQESDHKDEDRYDEDQIGEGFDDMGGGINSSNDNEDLDCPQERDESGKEHDNEDYDSDNNAEYNEEDDAQYDDCGGGFEGEDNEDNGGVENDGGDNGEEIDNGYGVDDGGANDDSNYDKPEPEPEPKPEPEPEPEPESSTGDYGENNNNGGDNGDYDN
ncbi:hypothetical protein L596_013491 [Steinernema carpocapsae]|uniref:PH domain-containing protein n=1 Tax=Steinernema carpocapsae TaxID=34508 RepID=A0A4U5P0D7_STECR|nr:hypothetical protein L596_013491 [Steinernema carpocapsae]